MPIARESETIGVSESFPRLLHQGRYCICRRAVALMFVAKIVVASCRYIRSCSVLSLKDEVEVDIASFSGYANSCSFNCLSLVRLFLDPVFSSDISSEIFKKIFLYSFFALFFTRSFRLFVRKLITRSLFPLLFPS